MTEKDYIKAELDLLKIAISAFIGSIFVLGYYILQTGDKTGGYNPFVAPLMIISFILTLILLAVYSVVGNKLKELP